MIASPRSPHSRAPSPSHQGPRSLHGQPSSERGDPLYEENLNLVNRLVLLRGVLVQMTVDAAPTRALRRARAENRVLRRELGLTQPRGS